MVGNGAKNDIVISGHQAQVHLAKGRRIFLAELGVLAISLLTATKNNDMTVPNGVTIRPSKFSVEETINRIAYFLQGKGATIYARIDQQSEVARVGKHIPPLEFIMFGNPKAGSAAMSAVPMSALDLPLKIISWEDGDKEVWIAYNQQSYLKDRYGLDYELSAPFDLDVMVSTAMAI